MNEAHLRRVAGELALQVSQIEATAALFEEGATIPFIARYRKERTGSLDEVAIGRIRDRLEQLAELDKRRTAIVESLTERNLLTDELNSRITAAPTLAELEDLYLPFRPKRRTRAIIAREKGLEPLAEKLLQQDPALVPEEAARASISAERGVADVTEALAGARDIIAERMAEDAAARGEVRQLFTREGLIESKVAKGKEADGAKYRDYFDWREPVARVAGHRFLAMVRGENEEFLRLGLRPPEDKALAILARRFVRGRGAAARQVEEALTDGYGRLLAPSLETEIRSALKEKADTEAIGVFAANLRELLLAPALGRKAVLAIDPGLRTGCKTVCLDPQGKLLHQTVIYPTQSAGAAAAAEREVLALCARFSVEAIAVGNGTGGRETETWVRKLPWPKPIPVLSVNESGASVYSASEVAREEFPDQDLTVRGAVSIGRRLMDPLAELVKIDPKAIGVGQYQHDVDQAQLKRSLDEVVASCVNLVGVEVNTASRQLLSYVSGIGPQLAANLVAWRDENGPFASRKQLRKVPRLGPKAFELAAGFLRIRDGEHPLDASAVHPERYDLVDRMARDLGCSVPDLLAQPELRQRIRLEAYVTEGGDSDEPSGGPGKKGGGRTPVSGSAKGPVGLPTLTDILAELAKPGRDPRDPFTVFSFAEGVEKLGDLHPGQRLPGIVTNVTRFGAFVDIGVHQDGLVHISQLADRFIKDPSEVVKVGQKVEVTVVEVDLPRKRISLTMRKNPLPPKPGPS